jgi:hypothetical protein
MRKRHFCYVWTPCTDDRTGLIVWRWLWFVWYDPATGCCHLTRDYVDPAELERRAVEAE